MPNTDRQTPEVSIVVPVYKNSRTLPELYARVRTVLEESGLSWELILVDDGCPEGSGEVARFIAQDDLRVKVREHRRNRGQSAAIWTGLGACRGQKVVVMDADLQDPPEAIPTLLDALDGGATSGASDVERKPGSRAASVVFGGRRGSYEDRLRLLAGQLFYRLLEAIVGIPADAGSFFAIEREGLDRLLHFDLEGVHLPTAIGIAGLRSVSIPVVREARRDGTSSYTLASRALVGLKAMATAMRASLLTASTAFTDSIGHQGDLQRNYFEGKLSPRMPPAQRPMSRAKSRRA